MSLVFADVLLAARSNDASIRESAVDHLRKMEEENLVNYLGSLSQELADPNKDKGMRILAATQLKNAVTAPSEANQNRLAQRWLVQDPNLRNQVHALLFQALATITGSTPQDKNLRMSTAQVIAIIGSIEIPYGHWQDLVPSLMNVIGDKSSNVGVLESAYTTLGYLCEALPGDALKPMANNILTAIAAGMTPEQPADIVYCATHALTDALPFCSANFANENERNIIMGMISGVMAHPTVNIRVAAWQCLGEVAENYYEYLGAYISGIFGATCETVGSVLNAAGDGPVQDEDSARVAMMAIEFWTTIGDYEHAVIRENEEAEDEGVEPTAKSFNYCKEAQATLLPLLLRCLAKQDEDGDEDELTLASAAGACLNEFCACIGPIISDTVLAFVSANINSPDWHWREAACFAMGCLLESRDAESFARNIISDAVKAILERVRDQSLVVRSSAAWCLKQVASSMPYIFSDPASLRACLDVVHASLDDDVKVVKFSAAVLYFLALATSRDANATDPAELPHNALSPYFDVLIQKLVSVADNSTSPDMHLACYEAMMQLIKFAAEDIDDKVAALLPIFIERLERSIASVAQVVPDDSNMSRLEDIANLQGLSVSIIQTILANMTAANMAPYADRLMTAFCAVLSGPTMKTASSVGEECLMAVVVLASEAKSAFGKYLPAFTPHLVAALEDPSNTDFCISGIRALSAVCYALEGMLSTDVMDLLLTALLASFNANDNVDRTVKLAIVETMPEIKISLGAQFTRYLPSIMMALVPASKMAVSTIHAEPLDADALDFLNKLQSKLLTAYLAFLTLVFDGAIQEIAGQVESMVQFTVALMGDPEVRPAIIGLAAEFAGDCCKHARTIHPSMPQMLVQWGILTVIEKAMNCTRKRTKKAGAAAKILYDKMLA